jgi:hypothetical protein
MTCTRSIDEIQALLDGTLGRIRAAELEQHLETCDTCRALAADLGQIRDVAATLGDPVPPDHVWLQVAGRLRQEGRVHDQPTISTTPRLQYVWLGLAASLVLAVGAALLMLFSQYTGPQAPTAGTTAESNVAAADVVQSGVEDLRKAEQLLQSGVAKLKEGLGSDDQALPAEIVGTLDQNLGILDRAIAESNEAWQKEPDNVTARNSLFEALQRKISLLQETITLMNEMRKGNAVGVANVVEGSNKS